MNADTNIKTIAQVYEAFGRGDVAAILDAVTDDVDWAAEASSAAAPWYGARHGKDAVAAFFEAFGLHHFFRFRDGKIAYYRGTEDTAQTEAALRD